MKILKQLLKAASVKASNEFLVLLALLVTVSLPLAASAQSLNLNQSSVGVQSAIIPIGPIDPMQALDTDFGPYDYRLAEPLQSLGSQLEATGNYNDALLVYQQALHVTRVNNGLYHESQVELVKRIIENNKALQNWEEVNNHFAYLEHLYRRIYEVKDPRLEIGLQQVVSWHVNALNINLDGKRLEHLQKANKLFKLRLKIAELTLTPDDPKFAFLHRNIAICERQLYLASDINKELMGKKNRPRRDRRVLANLD
jgi:tetratricopeptide (TPR) repeat protein